MFTANVAIARMGTDIDACQRSSVPAAAVTTNSTAITPTPPAPNERDQAEPEAEHPHRRCFADIACVESPGEVDGESREGREATAHTDPQGQADRMLRSEGPQ